MGKILWTIGHSNRSFEDFSALLAAHSIEQVADIRTVPKSRHNPQFNEEALKTALPEKGIRYVRLEKLGGFRRAKKDSPNGGWKNASFRGYADYMQTLAFAEALGVLERLAEGKRTAIMCAEAVPWRCHRSLVADALIVRGWEVRDILSEAPTKEHALTKFAKVDGERLAYPPLDESGQTALL